MSQDCIYMSVFDSCRAQTHKDSHEHKHSNNPMHLGGILLTVPTLVDRNDHNALPLGSLHDWLIGSVSS